MQFCQLNVDAGDQRLQVYGSTIVTQSIIKIKIMVHFCQFCLFYFVIAYCNIS